MVALFSLLSILIPLWNIPHTIAGRYISEGLILILVLFSRPNWKIFFCANKALLIFFIYLLIQLIFFSNNYQIALSNFRAEWMHFILFSIIGAGTGLMIGKYNSSSMLLLFGILFSIPLYIHLFLLIIKSASARLIPWGYTGINEIHGDLGYTALQAIIFLFTYLLYNARNLWTRTISIFLIAISVSSPILAVSRGGILFSLISVIFIAVLYFFSETANKISSKNKIIIFLTVCIFSLGAYQTSQLSNSSKWSGILAKISMGFQGNPQEVFCEGISSLQDVLESKGITISPSVQKGLDSVVDGDGARIMVARLGASLIADFPMGIDQSKQAYQLAISKRCNGAPAIFLSHTHNAWIDTALAIGIPGAILILAIMLSYMRNGLSALKRNTCASTSYGMALLATSCLWILRGFLDSVQRDQMLEMQAFVLALLLGIILSRNSDQIRM